MAVPYVRMAAGRFAPSPTGDLHLGNLRTAMIAWAWSRHDGDPFVLRMEDLDRITSSLAHERSQEADLHAIGLDWDGEVVRQSDRFDRYDAALDALADRGLLYPCYCTRREIAEAASAPHHPAGDRYPGTCRDLSDRERHEREDAGRPAALRFRAGAEVIEVDDRIVGPIRGAADDVVVRRNDGVPAYHLAVVVDDAEQGVDIVVRGDDLAAAVPSQVALQRALGRPTPTYAHVPLVLGPDGRRLAKRDGAVTLADRRALGDDDTAVVRCLLTSAGLAAEDSTALGTESPAELMQAAAVRFDPAAIRRDPLVLSPDTLRSPLPQQPR